MADPLTEHLRDSNNPQAVLDHRLTFSAAQLERLDAIGERRNFETGDRLFEEGQRVYELHAIVEGNVAIVEHVDDFDVLIARHGDGGFIGELNLFTGQATYLRAIACAPTQTIALNRTKLRQLVDQDPELSDILIRALSARRALLIEREGRTLRLVGSKHSAATLRLREFLVRNQLPHRYFEQESAPDDCADLLGRHDLDASSDAIVIWQGHTVLHAPSNGDLADVIGLTIDFENCNDFDMVVVGAGPSGLAAAVYGASEGLKTLVLESVALGGQAGTSSRIENFLGFPSGLSGQELATRAMVQALKFGAALAVPCAVEQLRHHDGCFSLTLASGAVVRSRSVVVASGARYRKLELDGLETFEGAGIYYAATETEARLCSDSEVVVVGGGNSAGQAAVFLSQKTRHVHLLIRGDDLGAKMSAYLVNRILDSPAITLHTHTEVDAVSGNGHLEQVTLRNNQSDATTSKAVGGLFVFIGAAPCTDWLPGCVGLDDKGFVPVGRDVADHGLDWPLDTRAPMYLESNRPGVFAVGDVRSGSIKRVASAVGEGSMAVKLVHEYLAEQAVAKDST